MTIHAFLSLCVCRFLLQSVFLKLINTNVFVFVFVFILADALGFLLFQFHPFREITKSPFTVMENICERKLSCNCSGFSESGHSQEGSIAPSCPLGQPITARDLARFAARRACHIISCLTTFCSFAKVNYMILHQDLLTDYITHTYALS